MENKYEIAVINDFLTSRKVRLMLSIIFKKLHINTISFSQLIENPAHGIVIVVDTDKISPGIICDMILEIRDFTDTPIWVLKDCQGTIERKLYLEVGVENCLNYLQSTEEMEKVITNLLDRLSNKDIEANKKAIRLSMRESRKKEKYIKNSYSRKITKMFDSMFND